MVDESVVGKSKSEFAICYKNEYDVLVCFGDERQNTKLFDLYSSALGKQFDLNKAEEGKPDAKDWQLYKVIFVPQQLTRSYKIVLMPKEVTASTIISTSFTASSNTFV